MNEAILRTCVYLGWESTLCVMFYTFVDVFDMSANLMMKRHVALLRKITIFYIVKRKF
jgi:hypothetical protein